MMLGAAQRFDLDQLDDALRRAPGPAPDLLRRVVAGLGTRFPVLRRSGKAAQFDRLIEAGAWTEAAFALIELEMPNWTVRRIVHENGEWLCALSRRPNLPLALDDAIEANHETLPLALLRAFIKACRRSGATAPEFAATVPQVRPMSDQWLCCDNFA